jgi:DNA-directed RNA polymerase I subunit RPA1
MVQGVSGKKKPKGAKVVEADDEDEDEEEEEDEDDAQGTLRFGRKNEEQEYDEDDDEVEKDEEGKVVQTRREEKGGEDGEENGAGDSPMDEGKKKGLSGVEGLPVYVSNHPLFEDVKLDAKNGVVEIAVKTRASSRRLLMVTLVESASEKCTVRTSEGISQAFVSDDTVMTAGCNFGELWDAADPEMLDLSTVSSNDIYQVLQTYGVEAARRTIVTEIKNVFGAYGIVVDPRHLGLVADFMTYQGGFRALNRIGMHLASSPFLQMSFETTGAFLTESALAGDIDNLTTPSAKLVVGQPTPNGTGCCSVMVPIAGMSFDKSR